MMSDRGQREDSRANRIARYKEERRQQLSSQIQARLAGESQKLSSGFDSPNGLRDRGATDGPRATRASRLRAAASAVNENGALKSPGTPEKSWERTRTPPSPMVTGSRTIMSALDKDKSSKRKSNLNKSVNSEELSSQKNSEDDKVGRRTKRSHETLDNSHQTFKSPIAKDTKSTLTFPNSFYKKISSDDFNSTSSPGSVKTTPKKSLLAIHMENARKGISGKVSDNVCKRQNVKNVSPSSSEENSPKLLNGIFNNGNDIVKYNGENTKLTYEKSRISRDHRDNEHRINMNRLNNLTTLTKETLARVERLTNKNPTRDSPKRTPESSSRRSRGTAPSSKSSSDDRAGPSTLRRMNFEDSRQEPSAPLHNRNASPVSILKRKTPVDDGKPETATNTPPVTFSPSVKEPSSSNKRQGILKKRRSLDEALVLRRRSCSPEVASKTDSKSILKTHRRSSLEELTRIHSPETHLQSILKRKSSKNEEDHDQSFSSPQSILKRRSGASSAGSTANTTPHVSITTAVILAAASGAEMVLESASTPFRPILKKKSISDDQSLSDNSHSDAPRPILKKKSSNETDDCDERLRPILKLRGSIDREPDKTGGQSDNETEVRPILKQSREDLSRSRFSFCEENVTESQEAVRRQQRNSRRSNTICADYTSAVLNGSSDERSILKRQRPSSVIELNNASTQAVSPLAFTGAIPKRSLVSRSSEKLKQQHTMEDKRAGSFHAASSSSEQLCSQYSQLTIQKEEFTNFLSSARNLNSDLDSCSKVSTDSAFQSLIDGLELEDNDSKFPEDCSSQFAMDSNEESNKSIHHVPNISITTETRDVKRHPVTFCGIDESRTTEEEGIESSEMDKFSKKKSGIQSADRSKGSRHSTQPVTSDEIREASKMQPDDPSNLSLSERIKLFNTKITKENQNNHALDEKGTLTDKRPKLGTKLGRSSSARISDTSFLTGKTASLTEKPPKLGTKLNRSSSARIPDSSSPNKSNIKHAY